LLYTNGQSLLEHLNNHPELLSSQTLLLIDWGLPDIDGLELAKQVCQLCDSAGKGDDRPINLMVTAHNLEEIQQAVDEREVAHCIDGILDKPLCSSKLFDAIILAQKTNHAELFVSKSSLADQRLHNVRILIVDDSEINCEVAEGILGGEGAIISLANDGLQALDWMHRNGTEVDIVLMDVHMPVMDGLLATQKIRDNSAWDHIPVLALTAGAFKEQRDKAIAAGMSGFIPKPFVADEAIKLILSSLKRTTDDDTLNDITEMAQENNSPEQHGNSPEQHENSPEQYENSPELATGETQEQMVFNPNAAESMGFTKDKYIHYLEIFIDDYQKQMNQLINPEVTAEQLRNFVHKLRGVSATMGLNQVASRAKFIEKLLIDEQEQKARTESELLYQDFNIAARQVEAFIADNSLANNSSESTFSTGSSVSVDKTQSDDKTQQNIKPLLESILTGLEKYSPEEVKDDIEQLSTYIDKTHIKAIDEALLRFDFEQAKEIVMNLLSEQ